MSDTVTDDALVLVVEDDAELGAQIVQHLRQDGFAAVWWRAGRAIEEDTLRGVSLVVLDLMLPEISGLDLLPMIRAHSDAPVLVLSARQDTGDKVGALAAGADDYMTKPFWPEELLARVRAHLRRPSLHRETLVEAGPLRLDVEGRRCTVREQPVELTRVEFELLLSLARRPGAALSRHWLVDAVLDPARDGGERTLDVHVYRLRKKLGAGVIETVWGVGYRLREDLA